MKFKKLPEKSEIWSNKMMAKQGFFLLPLNREPCLPRERIELPSNREKASPNMTHSFSYASKQLTKVVDLV